MCIEIVPSTPKSLPATSVQARVVPTSYRTNGELTAFVGAFESGKLPAAAWTHDAHLVVALHYARSYRPREAIDRLRDAIKRHNKATGTPETPTRGFHETVTVAWFHLVRHFLDVFDDGRSLAALADTVVGYFAKDVLLEHYSRERLTSLEARARWVEPDRRPLPELLAYGRPDRAWLNALEGRAALALDRKTAPAHGRAPTAISVVAPARTS